MSKRLKTKVGIAQTKNKKIFINLYPTSCLETVYINKSKTSWIKLLELTSSEGLNNDEFEKLWKEKPDVKHKIKIFNKLIDCPRYTKSYLKSYFFSGLNNEAQLELPKVVDRIFQEFAKKLNPELNQSLINWYDHDGSIGKHSDDTRLLKENSDIFSFSFGADRIFILEARPAL
jgi:hypothetical protein